MAGLRKAIQRSTINKQANNTFSQWQDIGDMFFDLANHALAPFGWLNLAENTIPTEMLREKHCSG